MFRIKFAGRVVVGLALSLLVVGVARAASISGFGGATDSVKVAGTTGLLQRIADDHGTIGLAGQFSSTSASIVLSYQDSNDPEGGVTCIFTSPFDVVFTQHTVPLVMTVTVGLSDSCFETFDHDLIDNVGNSISFYYFPGTAATGGSHFVGRSINLIDADGDIIEDQTVVGPVQ
jgi:hypothetical protein